MRHYFIILGIIHATKCISSVDALEIEEKYVSDQAAYCFQFTWVGGQLEDSINQSSQTINCTKWGGHPCIKPFIFTNDATLPNVTDMWETRNRSEIGCGMRDGLVCIKYNYIYNDAVQRISYFCGKMTEDKVKAVEEGCFTQKVDAHTVEACACQSVPGKLPCNSSSITHASLMNIIAVFLYTAFLLHCMRFKN